MAADEISIKKKWAKLEEALANGLNKEIEIMRELLANLNEEELSLKQQAYVRWSRIIQYRSDLVLQLRAQRLKREMTHQKLLTLSPFWEEWNCEILSRRDQLIALTERINLQNCRNEALFDLSKHRAPLLIATPKMAAPRKVKTKIATESLHPEERIPPN